MVLVVCTASCQRSAQYYLSRGDRFFDQGKYDEASLNYRSSIQRSPQDAQAHFKLALSELRADYPAFAYQELVRASQLAPDRSDIQAQLADLALALYSSDPKKPKSLYNQASSVASALLQKDANSFDGLRLRANILAIDGKFDEAVAILRRADLAKPLQPQVRLPMVQNLLQLRRVEEAERAAREFLKAHPESGAMYDVLLSEYARTNRFADAESLLKMKVANMPQDAQPSLQLASFYRQARRDPEMNQALQNVLSRPKDFPRGHGLVGDFYAETKAWPAAMREYQAGLAQNSNDKHFYQKKIVQVLIAQGKSEEAIKELDDELKDNPDDLDGRLARAILIRQRKDPKNLDFAISELSVVLAKNPRDEVAHYNLGLAYLSKDQVESGKSELRQSAQLRPGYLAPSLALAELAQKTGNYPEALRLSNEILGIDPSNVEARLWHAAALVGSKNYAQARPELDALVRDYPNSVDINLHLAVLDTMEKRYREAEARYIKFYKPGQQDLRPLEGLVQLRIAQGQMDGALKILEQELKAAPSSKAVHLLLASTAVRAGQLELATLQYEWLRANDPKSVQTYASLGDLYQLQGDLNSALQSYHKAQELAPSDPRITAMVAFLEINSGQNREAIVNLKKQLATDPENVIALNNLAYALAEAGTDLDQALSLAEKAQRKAPTNLGIADTVAWIYTKKGLNDSAIQIFNRLVKKYPDQPAFRYHLGVALLQKGETAEAKSEFIISLSKNPPKDIAEKIKQIISKIS